MRPAFRRIRTRREGVGMRSFASTTNRYRRSSGRSLYSSLDEAKVLTDLGERKPADLDEAEEALGREQAVVLVRVARVPVGPNERRHGVEHLRGVARVAHRLIRKVGCRLDDGEVCRNFRWDGRDGSVEVASRARLNRIR